MRYATVALPCLLVVHHLWASITAVTASEVYTKPDVSSKRCAAMIVEISEISLQAGNSGSCLGCDPAVEFCPEGCQEIVNKLYSACDGVTLPDGLYYDPKGSIGGAWSDAKPNVKIAVERCGCNRASFNRRTSLKGSSAALLLMAVAAVPVIQLGI